MKRTTVVRTLLFCLIVLASTIHSSDRVVATVEYETFEYFFNDNGVIRCAGEILTNDPNGSLFAVEGNLENPNQYSWYFHDHVNYPTYNVYAGADHPADVSGTWKCHLRFYPDWVHEDPEPTRHLELQVQ